MSYLWRHIDTSPPDSNCWEWTGCKNRKGYGNYRGKMAHRAVYQAVSGKIPDGLVLDHICRNRSCVNPGHLEPVTSLVNTRRGHGNGRKKHCLHGHEYTAANTYNNNGRRFCRQCARQRNK